MKLVIRSVWTWDHANIRTWTPFCAEDVAETINIDIGPKTSKGANTFSIRVATPKGLSRLDVRDGIIAIRPLLIIEKYDYQDLWNWLTKTVASCESDTWNASIDKLRMYFDYEYDYD